VVNVLPVLDVDRATPHELLAALQRTGAVSLRDAVLSPARCAATLTDARAFFALPDGDKRTLAIEGSPHFRGYSTMLTERDHREQLHFGSELPPGPATDAAPFWQLQGPNVWPSDAAWRQRVLAWLADAAAAAQRVLARVRDALALPDGAFGNDAPYLLLKLICYHAQAPGSAPRPGVAAHVDFSWLTLTLQDDVGGLEVRCPDGSWCAVPPEPGTVLVHTGELLQHATGNALLATPHRVVNPSAARARVSLPLFLAPGLDERVTRRLPLRTVLPETEHVHRVLPFAPARGAEPALHFGRAEWRRKGENVWCERCCADVRRAHSAVDRGPAPTPRGGPGAAAGSSPP
jgi:isopenicillin N synthase-like dioxygenase